MFTGLVEEIGTIVSHQNTPDGIEITIEGRKVMDDLEVNDSISCSGICLTAIKTDHKYFGVQIVKETLQRTTARYWNEGTKVNLERSLLPTSRMGGHFVQGHVDETIEIINITPGKDSAVWHFSLTDRIENYIVEKGSVCLDGISLTVAHKNKDYFTVALIPHTLDITTWNRKEVQDKVNIEVDIMAKYIESLIGVRSGV
ncbi:MAG: riboflavin synthase [Candidatus Marinimicrobia bacterium]|nr:riboflavin synthase [Candidatus Neomarinimicrobiota bacterium]|tara:strand:- start:303 stop:902 length:600 start_codon:yes stop_codon:yes gene_type:complete